jgi:AraC-like DNA-binding protein
MVVSSAIETLTFDTRGLPREHQFEAWRAYNSSVIDVSLSRDKRDAFAFEQQVWDLGSLVFTTSSMPGPLVPRHWQHLRKDPLDHWCIVLPESRSYTTGQAAGSPQVHFRSLGRPFEGSAADSSVSTIFVPRDLLRPIAASLDAHPGTVSSNGLGSLFADFLVSVERRLPSMTAQEVPRLVEAITAMISACIAPTSDRIAEASEPLASTMMERARQQIQQDLSSPTLNPQTLSRQLGISRSTLYSLFEPLHGVANYIQRQRLLAASKLLSDPDCRLSIQDVAQKFCFSDLSSFSRAFRRAIGSSPSDIKGAASRMELVSLPPPQSRSLLPRSGALTDIGRVLRHLQV